MFKANGLSISEISLLLSWWAFSALILEIPSGALADMWSRKKILTFAPLIKSICFILWFFANGNIWIYGLGFLFWSIGSSLVSGTNQALLYDNLVHFKKENQFSKIFGKSRSLALAFNATGMILGGILAEIGVDITLLLSVIPLILSSIFASQMFEAKKVRSTEEVKYLNYIKDAFKEIKSSRKLLFLFVIFMSVSILGVIEEYDQLLYEQIKIPLYLFGVFEFFRLGVSSFGSFIAHKFKKYPISFLLFPIIILISLIIISSHYSILSILLLLSVFFFNEIIFVLIEEKIQNGIASQSRATISSVSRFFIEGLVVIFGLIFTLSTKSAGLQSIYIIGAGAYLLVLIITILGFKFLQKK